MFATYSSSVLYLNVTNSNFFDVSFWFRLIVIAVLRVIKVVWKEL